MTNFDQVRLTETEMIVLRCLINGDSTKIIAWKTGIGLHTLKRYMLTDLYRKLGVRSRLQAAIWGWKHGFAPVPETFVPIHEALDNGVLT